MVVVVVVALVGVWDEWSQNTFKMYTVLSHMMSVDSCVDGRIFNLEFLSGVRVVTAHCGHKGATTLMLTSASTDHLLVLPLVQPTAEEIYHL